jgi:hypothetical protein
LAFWVGYAAAEIKPVWRRLRHELLCSTKLFVDETTAPVFDPGRGRTKKGYFWVRPVTDGRVLFGAADQIAAAQPQGVSSASRLLGQLLTSLVSTSVRYASGLTPCSLQLSINEASIAQFSAPSSLPANSAFFLLRAIGRIARSTVLESILRPSFSLTINHSPPGREQVPPHGCWNLNTLCAEDRHVTYEGRALVTEIQDRLIELYVQQDEARREHDPDRAHELQVEIDKATAQREEIRR